MKILRNQHDVTHSPAACYLYRHHLPPPRYKILFSSVPVTHCHLRKLSLYLGKIEESKSRVSDLVYGNFCWALSFAKPTFVSSRIDGEVALSDVQTMSRNATSNWAKALHDQMTVAKESKIHGGK